MRKPLFLAALAVAAILCAKVRADYPVKDIPAGAVGTGTSVSISTSAWTLLPTSSSLGQRGFLLVRDPSTNSANMICTTSTSTVVPVESTSTAEIEIVKGTVWKQPIDNNLNMFCVSLNTTAESVKVKEYKQ